MAGFKGLEEDQKEAAKRVIRTSMLKNNSLSSLVSLLDTMALGTETEQELARFMRSLSLAGLSRLIQDVQFDVTKEWFDFLKKKGQL
jgi:hypothetical protein